MNNKMLNIVILYCFIYFGSIGYGFSQYIYKTTSNSIPDKDALVGSGGYRNPNSNYGDGNTLQIGHESSSGGITHRSFMHFDLSVITSSDTIYSAILYLWCSQLVNSPVVNMYKVTSTWYETSITWNNQPEYDPRSYYQIQTVNSWNSINITDWITYWYSNPDSNFGFIIKSSNEAQESSSWFNSKDNSDNKPYLLISSKPDDIEESASGIPTYYGLSQNYPNPFNSSTNIEYELPIYQNAMLKIYNIYGQEVKTLINEFKVSGRYKVIWDGKDNYDKQVASGIYFYKIQAGNFVDVKRMVLIK